KARSQKMELAKITAIATAHEYRREHPSRGFVISGPVGTGKTHLLCATIHWLTLEAGFSARYVEISFLYSEIRNGFSRGQSVLDALQPLISPDVLAIDELGRGRCSEFELETIDELIARRYNTRKTTIFATNYLLTKKASAGGYRDPAQAQASHCLIDRIGERSWSRLNEMCHLIELPQETSDYRLNKARF
ncbi:MAG: ATP-binding protein, partial [Myxococcaceae bacterium]|nr:ATP-binding protein [Myxococcaceae bacterium]